MSFIVAIATLVAGTGFTTMRLAAEDLVATLSRSSPAPRVVALAVEIVAQDRVTSLNLTLSRSVTASIFTLGEPYRLILDLPKTDFRLPEAAAGTSKGIVKDYRFGLLTPDKSRLVVDMRGPFKLVDVRAELQGSGHSVIRLDVAPVKAGEFRAQGVPPRLQRSETMRKSAALATPWKARKKPVVVIDPGHGGPDPGAIGHAGKQEKMVVLAVARKLRARLAAGGRYDVVMTRDRDVFIALQDRVEIARKVRADLFISLHADAIPRAGFDAKIRGASVYTLSQRASDRQAARFAAKENASDALAGLNIASTSTGRVEAILFDLMRRETADFSQRLREHLVRRLKRTISMSRSPRRAAAFRVLQQPDTPSALIELGYMSNPADVGEMFRTGWQKSASGAIAAAVDAYFDSR